MRKILFKQYFNQYNILNGIWQQAQPILALSLNYSKLRNVACVLNNPFFACMTLKHLYLFTFGVWLQNDRIL